MITLQTAVDGGTSLAVTCVRFALSLLERLCRDGGVFMLP
jgi:hypothetical protein